MGRHRLIYVICWRGENDETFPHDPEYSKAAAYRGAGSRGAHMSDAKPQCISGTFSNDGRVISATIRARHAAQLRSAPAAIRSQRSPREWKELYALAMAEKRQFNSKG
jgi:hypothetical protein